MALFGSQEWLDEFCQALNNDPDYQEAARDYEGDMICVSLPEEGFCGRSPGAVLQSLSWTDKRMGDFI